MAIPEIFIQELLNRVDIIDVIDASVPLRKAGANYSACCPFHNEKTPSFTVSPTKQFYHCFGCGAHGTALGFLIEYQGLGFVDAVHELAKRVGMTVPQEVRSEQDLVAQKAAVSMHEALQLALGYYRGELKKSDKAIAYLKGRGLSGEIAARFQIGYAPSGWQNLSAVLPDYQSESLVTAGLVIANEQGKRYDRFRDRIMFPIHDQKGQVIGFGGRVLGGEAADAGPKYLNSPETPLFQKGHELYGLFTARRAIREAGRVLVVEGYMDVVALAQYGINYAVAALGTATTPFHITKLMRQTDDIAFCFDGDAAGGKAAWRAAMNSLPALTDSLRLSFLFLPPEHDPDSYVREFGKEAFEQALQGALPLSQYLVEKLSEQNDLQSQEDRVRFMNEAEPILKQIQAPRLGLLLRKRVAQLVGMSLEELESALGLKQTAVRRAPGPQRVNRKPLTLVRHLIHMVLARPQLAAGLEVGLVSDRTAEGEVLRHLLELAASRPHLSSQAMLQALQGEVPEQLRTELSSELMEVDDTLNLEHEFAGAVQQLQIAWEKQVSTAAELLLLAQEKGLQALTADQRALLQGSRWGHGKRKE
ncbi:DNA primase [mine drainage metagenome]|uniref:DNA primase n=1 Tax=mine drainage metagenome TaxID=410659 RepID=A0A1J5PXR6_9ZZZZ